MMESQPSAPKDPGAQIEGLDDSLQYKVNVEFDNKGKKVVKYFQGRGENIKQEVADMVEDLGPITKIKSLNTW